MHGLTQNYPMYTYACYFVKIGLGGGLLIINGFSGGGTQS